MTVSLPKDITLWDLRTSLNDEDTFVSQALHQLRLARKTHADACLRLGITGTGALPNYRLEAGGEVLVAIDGSNHRPWTGGYDATRPDNWSEKTMSYDDVAELLVVIRSIKR